MSTSTVPKPCAVQPTDLEAIEAQVAPLILSEFNSNTAFEIGTLLRQRLVNCEKPAVIAIFLSNSGGQLLFWSTNRSGTAPDNEYWVRRKLATVLRFNVPSWYLSNKFGHNEELFAAKYGLSDTQAAGYAIHGGGVPIRVAGVEGPVGVVIVSGLKQDEDHGVVVEALEEYLKNLKK